MMYRIIPKIAGDYMDPYHVIAADKQEAVDIVKELFVDDYETHTWQTDNDTIYWVDDTGYQFVDFMIRELG